MRVWISPSAFFPHRGGVEELTRKLGLHLTGLGHDVTVVTNRWPIELLSEEDVDGLRIVRPVFTLPGRDPRSWPAYLSTAREARGLLTSLPVPDVVHIQCPSSQTPHVGAYARTLRLPLVVTTQGETYMDAGCLYERSRFARRNLRRVARGAAALTACSRHAANGAARIAPSYADALIVPNGIDPTDWSDLPSVREPIIAAWGRHVPQKGFDLLLEAFAMLRGHVPGARLLLGGDGPETARLQGLAGPDVTFLGPLDRAGVRSLLARCRVAAVPSRVEPFGIVALEALSAGRGLVYSSRGGMGVAAGDLGRAIDPYDTDLFCRALLDELHSPTPAAQGQAHAVRFSWGLITEQYVHIYEDLLDRSASS